MILLYVYLDLLRPITKKIIECLYMKDSEILNVKYCGSDLRHYLPNI